MKGDVGDICLHETMGLSGTSGDLGQDISPRGVASCGPLMTTGAFS